MTGEDLQNGCFLHVVGDGLPPCYSGGCMLSAVDDRICNQANQTIFVGDPREAIFIYLIWERHVSLMSEVHYMRMKMSPETTDGLESMLPEVAHIGWDH